jgi:hypothetical protein
MRSHFVGSARLLHPRGVAEVGRSQDRVVVATDDRGWCSANREAAASAETTLCLPSLIRRVAQPHDSTTSDNRQRPQAPLSRPPRRRSPLRRDRWLHDFCNERHQPRRPTRPRLPVRPAMQHSAGADLTGRPTPLATNS